MKLKDLLNEASKTLWRIEESGDGRSVDNYWGVFKASSQQEARDLAAKHWKNKEMNTIGQYSAEPVTTSQLNNLKKDFEAKIITMTKIMN